MISKIYLIVTALIEIMFFVFVMIKVRSLLVVFILLFLLFVISTLNVFWGLSIDAWENIKKSHVPELTYTKFISLFDTIPERFTLKDNLILYKCYKDNEPYTQCVGFKTYKDYLKYRRFLKRNAKLKKKMAQMEAQKEFESNVQRDLEKRVK